MFDLSGHVGLVTGGNSGIGVGLASGLLKAGASVAVWGRRAEKNREVVERLSALGTVASFEVDVTDEAAVRRGIDETVDRFGRINSCFANAGGSEPVPFMETSLELWNRMLSLNLTSTFLTFREAARHMIARGGGGKLIGLSSIGGLSYGMPKNEPYSASKAGICALVRSVAVELARHDIQANAIVPGWIETAATQDLVAHQRFSDTIRSRTPLKRWGTADEFEAVAVYLAAAPRFHTGDVITIDGGYTKF